MRPITHARRLRRYNCAKTSIFHYVDCTRRRFSRRRRRQRERERTFARVITNLFSYCTRVTCCPRIISYGPFVCVRVRVCVCVCVFVCVCAISPMDGPTGRAGGCRRLRYAPRLRHAALRPSIDELRDSPVPQPSWPRVHKSPPRRVRSRRSTGQQCSNLRSRRRRLSDGRTDGRMDGRMEDDK